MQQDSVALSDAVRDLMISEGIPEEMIYEFIEEAFRAMYKKKYKTDKNAVTKRDELRGTVYLFSRKEVVEDEDFDDEIVEIELSKAKELNPECEIGDEVLVEVRIPDFDRRDVGVAIQTVKQKINGFKKDALYAEYQNKVGQLVSGEVLRERYNTIFVELGKADAILPVGEQSLREKYKQGDRIRAIIKEVNKNNRGTSIILSRASTDFIRALFELEVPEISDNIVDIMGVVRDVGSRTKIAVYSSQIDPVGACVGMRGIRIQSIVKELEGEKIDIVPYEQEIRKYIKNALLPAKVQRVIVLDEEEKSVASIVEKDQLSLAIGKKGQNVRLACDLTGWRIDVITPEEYEENPSDYKDVSQLDWHGTFIEEEEETHDVSMLEGLPQIVIEKLREVGFTTIESIVETPREEIESIPGIGPKTSELIFKVLNEMVEVVDEEDEENEEEVSTEETTEKQEGDKEEKTEKITEKEIDIVHQYEYEYECPECGNPINEMIIVCPKCGIELEFE